MKQDAISLLEESHQQLVRVLADVRAQPAAKLCEEAVIGVLPQVTAQLGKYIGTEDARIYSAEALRRMLVGFAIDLVSMQVFHIREQVKPKRGIR